MKEAKAGSKKKPAVKSSKTRPKNTRGASTQSAAKSEKRDSGSETGSATKKDTSEQTAGASSAPKPQIVDKEPQLPAGHGKIGVFGGPKDRGIKPDDKLALPTGPHGVYERIRSLNPKSFYCAMRWNYHVEHLTPEEVKRWWANKKLLVTNPKNGVSVVVRAVDYGPHENTGLDISISPGAAAALEVEASDEVDIALADPKAQLGRQ